MNRQVNRHAQARAGTKAKQPDEAVTGGVIQGLFLGARPRRTDRHRCNGTRCSGAQDRPPRAAAPC
jgi:hypothetical protein